MVGGHPPGKVPMGESPWIFVGHMGILCIGDLLSVIWEYCVLGICCLSYGNTVYWGFVVGHMGKLCIVDFGLSYGNIF